MKHEDLFSLKKKKKKKKKLECLLQILLWAYSANGKFMIFFLFFPENRIRQYMQIVSNGDILYKISNPVFWGK